MNKRSKSLADYGRVLNNFSRLRMKEHSESQRNYERFLNRFGCLRLQRKPKTLLEIARFPHSELAHSNILAFFLDPNEEHGLGDTFLNSLLKTADSELASGERIQTRASTSLLKGIRLL
jgi:PD-(D/E)XK nuclease superfamily